MAHSTLPLPNLERMWQVRESVPRENHNDFLAYLLGSLSVKVQPEHWEDSLQLAKEATDGNPTN